jgi:CheY-like chemotaxis protein
MPKLNGREALQWIKNKVELKNVSVVIYSTSLNPIEKEQCMALGAHSYVVKPISYKESITIAENFVSLTTVLNDHAMK